VSACTELVNGANQLAQNAVFGMAAICGHGVVPSASPGLNFVPQPEKLVTIPALRTGSRPVISAHDIIHSPRLYVPHAAANFASIDPDSDNRNLLAAISVRLVEISAVAEPERSKAHAIQSMPGAGLQMAKAVAQNHMVRNVQYRSGVGKSGGYVFYDDADSDYEAGASQDVATDISDTIMAAPIISGEAGGDVSGDTKSGNANDDVGADAKDPQTSDYSLSPEMLMSRGGITLSGGYSSVEGVNLGGKIARQNIGGADREVSASARYSKIRQLFEIGYADGNFLGSRLGFAPTLFAQRTSAKGFGIGLGSTPFAQSSYGIGIQFSRTFESHISVKANYRLSADAFRMRGKNNICDASFFGSPICTALGSVTNSLLSVSLAFDRRQRDGNKIRGYRFRLAQDVGLGGTAPYTKTRVGGEVHIGLGSRWTLLLDAEAGYMAPIGKRDIPLFDRFYAGDTSLRGFDLRGVGPKVQPTGAGNGQNVAIGGRTYYAASAELSVSVGGFFEKFGLQPSLFVDAGSVFGAKSNRLLPGEQLLGNSAKPRVSAGVGLAMKTPAGTLRLDFARALVKQPGDRSQAFSISFGAAI
jgi:Omp85 superfamily domain